jgi:dienelactone hydrolase
MNSLLHSTDMRDVSIPVGNEAIEGILAVPPQPLGVVLFAHGSGSSRFSRRNRYVADTLNQHGVATLLMDLLTPREARFDERSGSLRFDIPFLAKRLDTVASWLRHEPAVKGLPLGYFGSSTGAAAALVVAACHPQSVCTVVSRGGRPDLADEALPFVQAPTLLIVGGADTEVLELNRRAVLNMQAPTRLTVVPGATHLFEEPGALAEVATAASAWFVRHFKAEVPHVPQS